MTLTSQKNRTQLHSMRKNTRTLGLRKYAGGYLWCYTCLQILQNISRQPDVPATPPIRTNWNLRKIQLSTCAHHLLKLKTPAGFGVKHFRPSGALGVTVLVVLASPRCENTSLATCSKLNFLPKELGAQHSHSTSLNKQLAPSPFFQKKQLTTHVLFAKRLSQRLAIG